MRLKYYMLTFRQMKLKKSFVFFIYVFLVVILFLFIINMVVVPTLEPLINTNVKVLALNAINETIKNNMSSLEYDDFVTIQKDENGNIDSIKANVNKINLLSSKLSTDIQNYITNTETLKVKYPLGNLFGIKLISGFGPDFNVKIVPDGIIEIKFKSNFESTGINQTKHSIYLSINANMMCVAPFLSEKINYSNDVIIAENVIIGNIPQTYYNIQGIENLDKSDTLNMLQE